MTNPQTITHHIATESGGRLSTAQRGGAGIRHNYDPSLDFFSTPEWATRALLKREDIRKAWEPACGTGAISEAANGRVIFSSDVHDHGYYMMCERSSVFGYNEMPGGARNIISNPPYNIAQKFISHCLELLPQGGGMRDARAARVFGVGETRRVVAEIRPSHSLCHGEQSAFRRHIFTDADSVVCMGKGFYWRTCNTLDNG